jgi:hypothetical protein
VESRPESTFAKRERNSINATANARAAGGTIRTEHGGHDSRRKKITSDPTPKHRRPSFHAGYVYASGTSEEQHRVAGKRRKTLVIALRPNYPNYWKNFIIIYS